MGVDERAIKEATIWAHLKAVVSHVVGERPKDPTNNLACISNFALSGKMVPPPSTTIFQDQRPKGTQALPVQQLGDDVEWARRFARQVVPPKPPKKDDEEEEPAAEEDKGELCDVAQEQEVLRAFGEGLTEAETFRLTVSLKRLLDVEPLAKVRFWGKILGTRRDYYIAETKIDESRVPEKDAVEEEAPEQTGKPPETIYQGLNTHKAREAVRVLAEDQKGTNEFKYYAATSDDVTEWTPLPDVLPAHITTARFITAPFTGHLDTRVVSHPPFPGVERHYLRAQIARISHACHVCPKDIYTTDKPEEEEDEEGNPKPRRYEVAAYEDIPPMNAQDVPDASDAEAVAPVKAWFSGYKNDELLTPTNWVHTAPQLLAEGRATKFKPEDEPPAEEDAAEDEPPAPAVEHIHPFLGDVAHDRPLDYKTHSKAALPAWALRRAYSNPSDSTKKYLARSLTWLGAMTFAVCEADKPGAQFQSVYIGRGLKSVRPSMAAFAPPLPPLPSLEYPVTGVRLQKDCSVDDELEFEPAPPPPKVEGEGEEGGEGGDE